MDRIEFGLSGGCAWLSKRDSDGDTNSLIDLTPFLDGGLEGLSLNDVECEHGDYDRIVPESETAIAVKGRKLEVTAKFAVVDVRGTERGNERYDDFHTFPYLDMTHGLKLVASTAEDGEVELPLLDYASLDDISPLSFLCPDMGTLLGGDVNVTDGRLHFTAVFKPDRLIMGVNCAQLGQ